MDRRRFLLRSSGALALPMLFRGVPLKAFDGPLLQNLTNTAAMSDRVLVLVQLNGGNDGINTVVPLDQYDDYVTARPGVALPEASLLRLTEATALHPAMTGVHTLWKERKVALVQGVSYPSPNLSHFRATDIWMTGSNSDEYLSSGWVGRYLDTQYPGYPADYPSDVMPDPIAIQMSATVSLALSGFEQQAMGIALQDPESFYDLVNGTTSGGGGLPMAAEARENTLYVRDIQAKSQTYSTVIKAAADKGGNKADYPSENRLAAQLQIVARLIAGGLKTRVYVATLGGFDTHAGQVDDGDATRGVHANLLGQLGDAVLAFQRDLEANKVDDRVVAMTFSEFGRRVHSNLSLGTDHGTSAPLFFFGSPVQDGIVGVNPSLTDLDNDNLLMQHDMRQVYASALQQWFGADPATLQEILLGGYGTVPVIRAAATSVTDGPTGDIGHHLHAIVPNPVRGITTIVVDVTHMARLQGGLYDARGFLVASIVDAVVAPATYRWPLDVGALPSGSYHVRMSIDGTVLHRPLVVVR